MEQDIFKLQQENDRIMQEMADLNRKIESFSSELKAQQHDGYDGNRIKLENLTGLFRTISDATEFSRATTVADRVPSSFGEQILIYNNAGTFKLYVYDSVGKVWKNVTIA